MGDHIKLNLGCGGNILPGYINIDTKQYDDSVMLMDVKDLIFPNESVEEILAESVLEHISVFDTQETLWEWWRVLETNGKLEIVVPDFDVIAAEWLAGRMSRTILLRYLYCPVLNPTRQMPHLNMFDKRSLRELLEVEDFRIVSEVNEEANLRVVAIKNYRN